MQIGSGLSRTDDAGLAAAEAADAAAQGLDRPCDLAVLFTTGDHAGGLAAATAAVRSRLDPGVMVGAVAQGVVGPGTEVEDGPAVSVWCAAVDPPGRVEPFRSGLVRLEDGTVAVVGWPDTDPDDVTIVLADPHSFPIGQVVEHLGEERPGHRVLGGLVTPGERPGRLTVGRAGDQPELLEAGAVGVVLRDVPVEVAVSQGCRPVGEPFVVTRADGNLLHELAGQSATERLREIMEEAPPEDAALMRRGLQVGIVVDEYQDTFGTGDFLIRAVLGADPSSGAVSVGDAIRVGQVVQFQVRDAGSADAELRSLLATQRDAAGALIFTCNGRGERFFGAPDHDAVVVGELSTTQVAGAFCAGEIGPVGERNFLHGFTASIALFRDGARPAAT